MCHHLICFSGHLYSVMHKILAQFLVEEKVGFILLRVSRDQPNPALVIFTCIGLGKVKPMLRVIHTCKNATVE